MDIDCEAIHEYGIDVPNRIIYLHHLGGDNSIGWQTSSRFIKNLDYLESLSKKPILIKIIASDGGDLADGIAMYSAIKRSQCVITMIGYGIVCSAATIIMQAADKRILTSECEFMFHHGSISFEQSTLAAKSIIKSSNRSNKLMLKIYAEKCVNGPFFKERGYSLSRVKNYLETKMKNEGDVFLTSEEAVEMGFADEVI